MADWYTTLEHIEGKLKESFPDYDVAMHPGTFSEQELDALPADETLIRVSVDDMPELETFGNGEFKAMLKMSSVIICSEIETAQRLKTLASGVMSLVTLLRNQDWGEKETYETIRPKTIAAGNLYNDEQGTNRYGMWVVSWDQPVKQVK